jgi:hypothetical protein
MDRSGATGVSVADRPWEWEDVRATADDDGVRLTHIHDGAQLILRNGRLVRGPGYAQASRQARRSLSRVGAILRLRSRGRYLVHAAAVVDPTGNAWLLAGDSGSGKSTLAWVLVRSGWSLLGDDGVVLEDTGTGCVARAWREPLRVSLDLTRHFPELQSLASQRAIGDARSRVPVTHAVVPSAPVSTLLFLARRSRDQIVRVGPAVALASLVRQSPWVLIDDADAPRHLSVLAAVAGCIPAFHVAHTERQLEHFAATLEGLTLRD